MRKLVKREDGQELNSYYEMMRCSCGICACASCSCPNPNVLIAETSQHIVNSRASDIAAGYSGGLSS